MAGDFLRATLAAFFSQRLPATLAVACQPIENRPGRNVENTRHQGDRLVPHHHCFDHFFTFLTSFFGSVHAPILTWTMRKLMRQLIAMI
jgi:hypothetical protein